MEELKSKFKKIVLFTLVSVYILILVGGVVRATGSGLGCPDWPKCFGTWVPPMSEAELPSNYQQIFKVAGKEIAPFSAFKTWTEYLNRLLGALIGIFVFIVALRSIPFWKTPHKSLVYQAFGVFFLTGLQGWLGSVVVSTHLMPYMVTAHMIVALIIVILLTNLYHDIDKKKWPSKRLKKILLLTMLVSIAQLVIGSQVREGVDHILSMGTARGNVISELGEVFELHRLGAIAVFFLQLFFGVELFKRNKPKDRLYSSSLMGFVLLSLITGLVLSYFSLAPWSQPIHLLLAFLLIGVQYRVYKLL